MTDTGNKIINYICEKCGWQDDDWDIAVNCKPCHKCDNYMTPQRWPKNGYRWRFNDESKGD